MYFAGLLPLCKVVPTIYNILYIVYRVGQLIIHRISNALGSYKDLYLVTILSMLQM